MYSVHVAAPSGLEYIGNLVHNYIQCLYSVQMYNTVFVRLKKFCKLDQ